MTKYNKLTLYYQSGLWDAQRIRNAVKKGWLTEEEADEILRGEAEYKEGGDGDD